jgi:hypothetical protein
MKVNAKLIPHDTQVNSAIRQFDVLKNMDTNARAEMTFQLSDNLRSIVEAGIHQRHPGYNLDEIKQAALSLVVDRNLLSQAFLGHEVPA